MLTAAGGDNDKSRVGRGLPIQAWRTENEVGEVRRDLKEGGRNHVG